MTEVQRMKVEYLLDKGVSINKIHMYNLNDLYSETKNLEWCKQKAEEQHKERKRFDEDLERILEERRNKLNKSHNDETI